MKNNNRNINYKETLTEIVFSGKICLAMPKKLGNYYKNKCLTHAH